MDNIGKFASMAWALSLSMLLNHHAHSQEPLSPPDNITIQLLDSLPKSTPKTVTSNTRSTFSEVRNSGLSNGCYPDEQHYLAEYLYQNPQACFWNVDSANKTIETVAIPQPPSSAIALPPPTGSDDTAMLESIINSNSGGSVVGQGIYIVDGLQINVPIDIYDMPMRVPSNSQEVVIVNSQDVRIFNSPIDAQNSNSSSIGFHVKNGSDRFVLVNSGFSNIYHTQNKNAAGVYLRAVDDFHITCNTFENIINDAADPNVTARANSIWMAGGKSGETSGGVIANNYSSNHQSNGKLNDAEFFTVQSYAKTDPSNPTRIFANRTLNAGKRLTKHQESNGLVLSNEYQWSEKQGPLGKRSLLSHVEVQFSHNVTARNNRVIVSAGSQFDYILNTDMHIGNEIQRDIHYDCNDIEIKDQLSSTSGNIPHIFVARASRQSLNSTGFEAKNSSIKNNRVHGSGSVKFIYWFGHGYDDTGGPLDINGNTIEIDYTKSLYKTP